MFERILAATDILTICDAPVLTAAHIAGQHNARLYILHVLESAYVENRYLIQDFRTGAETINTAEYEKTVKEEINKTYSKILPPHINYEIRVTLGFPWEEILKWAQEVSSDLIVLGPHSKRAEEKGVVRVVGKVGSTAEGVITREKCPVMIVNAPIPEEKLEFKKVLVSIDFSNSCECAVCFAVKLAQKYSSKLFTFHMIPIPPYPKYSRDDYEADIDASTKRVEKFYHDFLDGSDYDYNIWGGALPHLEILKCAEKNGADLIVLGSHTKEKDGKWYAGSVVERVSHRADCPVIVITDPDVLVTWADSPAAKVKAEKEKNRLIHVYSKK